MVVHRFWPHPGGSERLFYRMARRLADKGLEVTVFTTDAWHPESYHKPKKRRLRAGVETHDGLTIHRFGIRNIPLQFKALRAVSLLPVEALRLLTGSPYVLVPDFLKEIFRRRPRFDLILAGPLPYTHLIYPAAWLARLHRTPWVCVPLVHTGVAGKAPSPGYLTGPQLRLLRGADAIMTATEAEGRVLAERGLNPSRIHRLGVGIDPEEFAGGEAARFRARFRLENKIVLQVSTLSRAKGAIDLLEAMKLLWNTGSDARLVLIGPPMADFEKHFAAQPEDVRARTLFLGPTDEATKKDAFAACDLFAMASSADSFGTVYLEAWLYGKPVVGARAGGVPDVVTHERDGLLVNFGQPKELADSVARLLSDERLSQALGQHGRRKVLDEYTLDALFLRFDKVIEPLIADGRSAVEAAQNTS